MKLNDIEQAASLKRERDSRIAQINGLWAEIEELNLQLKALGVRVEEPGLHVRAVE